MPRFNFEVEREVKRPRHRRGKVIRLTVLFCVVAAITAAVICALLPDRDQEIAVPENKTAAGSREERTGDLPVREENKEDSSGNEPVTDAGSNTANSDSDSQIPADDGAKQPDGSDPGSHSTAGGDAKYDPPQPELAVHTKMFRQALEDGSWKQGKYTVAHTVQGGDTLGLLTGKYHNTRHFARKFNGIDNPDTIRIGQKLYFIHADSWQVTISRRNGTLQIDRVINGSPVPFLVFSCRIASAGVRRDDLVICSRIAKPVFRDAHGRVFPNGSDGNPYGDFLITLAGRSKPASPILHLPIHGSGDPAAAENSLRGGAVQLNNEDISLLYCLIPEGSPVRIVE